MGRSTIGEGSDLEDSGGKGIDSLQITIEIAKAVGPIVLALLPYMFKKS
jgi:hypothetical protein